MPAKGDDGEVLRAIIRRGPQPINMHPQHAARSRSFSTFSLAPLIVLPLSLDFKGEGGGLWQYLITGVTLVAAVVYLAANRPTRVRSGLFRFAVIALWLPVLGGLLTFAMNDVSFDRFVRVAVQIWLFALSMMIGMRITGRGQGPTLERLMFIGCGVAVFFTLAAGFLVSGESASQIRYQILSPVLLAFEAMLLYRIIVQHNQRVREVLLLAACICIQLLSVTRSSLLGLVLIGLAALWISSPTIGSFLRRAIVVMLAGTLLGFVAIEATSLVTPEISERWSSRLGSGEQDAIDPTTLSRVAELKEQLRLWHSDVLSVIFGRGYGASYGWAEEFFDDLVRTGQFNEEFVAAQYFEAGHNYWVSTLFGGGLLFGTTPQLLMVWAVLRGLRTSRARNWASQPEGQSAALCTLLLMSFIATTIGGNPMGGRYQPLITGLALGMFMVLDARRLKLERERQQRRLSQ